MSQNQIQSPFETNLKYKFWFNQFNYFVNTNSTDRKKAEEKLTDLSSKDEQNNNDKRLKRTLKKLEFGRKISIEDTVSYRFIQA